MVTQLFRKMVLAGLGLQVKLNEVMDDLVEKGQHNDRREAQAVREWMERTLRSREELDQCLQEAVQKAVSSLGLPTRKDLESLEARLQELVERLEQMESRRS